jgi:2,4-dienoyl-CoA reductase-like NADH-dependent reductase (Old Yellow Enzyme family)
MTSPLFSPLTIRDLTLKNRLAVSPMCQYSARHGLANDWHFAHLARFALGGFGTVMVEATGVTAEGRITYGCLGLWDDAQIAPLARIAAVVKSQGAAAAIQLGHAGRKASTALWWRNGFDETDAEKADVAFEHWKPVGPMPIAHVQDDEYQTPRALEIGEFPALVQSFADAATRADKAGFDIVEIHAAHGYLLNQFLSPLGNQRTDAYGGSFDNRTRLPLEIVQAMRAVWPAGKPLFMRMSVQDAAPGGWTVEDSIAFSRIIREMGVDLIDCSSGGFEGATLNVGPCFQAPLAQALRSSGMPTMAVGLISTPQEAEALVAGGHSDLIALGRTALDDPNWPHHARAALEGDDSYAHWPRQTGFAVRNRDRSLRRTPQVS